MDLVNAYAKICRAEYLKGELPAVIIPALLTASTFAELTAINVVESIAVFSLLYVTGFMMNAVTDREIDLKYGSFKREIGRATTALGERKVVALIAAQIAVGFALAADLAARLQNPWLLPLVALGVFLGLAYSVPPFSFKTRGVAAHAFSLAFSAFVVPFTFLYVAASGSLDLPGLFLISAFSLTAYSLEYANQAYDFTEDLEAGLATPVVRLGLRRSLRLSFITFAVGLPLLAFSAAYLTLSSPSVAYALGEAGRAPLAAAAVGAVLAGYYLPLRGMARIARAAQADEREDAAVLVERIKGECNYSLWQTSGVLGLAAFAAMIFLVSSAASSAVVASAQESLAFAPGASGSSYFDFSGPKADVSASIVAGPAASKIPQAALVRADLFAPGQSQPYGSEFQAVLLPPPGSSFDIAFKGVSLRPGQATTVRLTLLVDSDFDGRADAEATATALTVPPPI